MIYKAVKYILENDATFAAAIGTDNGDIKVYPIHPRKEVSLPFCVFNIEDQQTNPTKDNPSYNGLDEVRIRVSIMDDDLDNVVDITEKARLALEGQKAGGTYAGVVIDSIDLERMSDDYATEYGDRGAIILNSDYIIWTTP
jgi:hypothetical protein